MNKHLFYSQIEFMMEYWKVWDDDMSDEVKKSKFSMLLVYDPKPTIYGIYGSWYSFSVAVRSDTSFSSTDDAYFGTCNKVEANSEKSESIKNKTRFIPFVRELRKFIMKNFRYHEN